VAELELGPPGGAVKCPPHEVVLTRSTQITSTIQRVNLLRRIPGSKSPRLSKVTPEAGKKYVWFRRWFPGLEFEEAVVPDDVPMVTVIGCAVAELVKVLGETSQVKLNFDSGDGSPPFRVAVVQLKVTVALRGACGFGGRLTFVTEDCPTKTDPTEMVAGELVTKPLALVAVAQNVVVALNGPVVYTL
jgi:hypothetical protein